MAEGGGLASKEEDELNIPRAALNKMIKELVPNIRIANDARELILNCCTEFIHLLSSEANEICNKQQKKTISPEHILAGIHRRDCIHKTRGAKMALGREPYFRI